MCPPHPHPEPRVLIRKECESLPPRQHRKICRYAFVVVLTKTLILEKSSNHFLNNENLEWKLSDSAHLEQT